MRVRTTKKEFKELVQAHVIECLSEDVTTDLKEQLQQVVVEFTSWYSPYEQKMTPNRYTAFKDWLLGLPSVFSIEHYYGVISEKLEYWFTECGGTYNKEHGSTKEAELYYHLMVREFTTLCRKNGIDFY